MGDLKVILNNHNLRDLNRVSAIIVSTFGLHVSIYSVDHTFLFAVRLREVISNRRRKIPPAVEQATDRIMFHTFT
ncbi:hypothetical protein HanXRQr2_Chr16g0724111 [Helianthus annuus]|uniref:Uncharacterized protein n=1 Tax=Helianthus annuus TaxID=4232 RepID=A0A9K3DMG9_HELAN|nr:hypothetical protein HanXRQr2_Chr16g0724111 [Helianthus annuus]KAJ0458672.1 hypothetical protein HanHA89_Chr16g0640461 [Helianthus annuus]KAJ0464072.1 hypothetical protein HanHA300_Chr14g0522861 [Helianthus annuus]KAJ0559993.1 hypothetical protein HanHA300_Chr06g0206581 [Helianthus annuus]KAJ0643171.1 hypothetical protein HanOQP8_Chr16g0597681 [Helianthus annuus]